MYLSWARGVLVQLKSLRMVSLNHLTGLESGRLSSQVRTALSHSLVSQREYRGEAAASGEERK